MQGNITQQHHSTQHKKHNTTQTVIIQTERDITKLDEEINQIITQRVSGQYVAIYKRLFAEQDLACSFEIKRYLFFIYFHCYSSLLLFRFATLFAETHWPFLPLKLSMYQCEILDNFASKPAVDKSVLTLNLCTAVHAGM